MKRALFAVMLLGCASSTESTAPTSGPDASPIDAFVEEDTRIGEDTATTIDGAPPPDTTSDGGVVTKDAPPATGASCADAIDITSTLAGTPMTIAPGKSASDVLSCVGSGGSKTYLKLAVEVGNYRVDFSGASADIPGPAITVRGSCDVASRTLACNGKGGALNTTFGVGSAGSVVFVVDGASASFSISVKKLPNCLFDSDCPSIATRCYGGACLPELTCPSGKADCDKIYDNGCEATLAADPMNCGACGKTCVTPVHGTATCEASACKVVCDPGYVTCNPFGFGCESDPKNDSLNCGTCGNDCKMGGCNAGTCSPKPTLVGMIDKAPQAAAADDSAVYFGIEKGFASTYPLQKLDLSTKVVSTLASVGRPVTSIAVSPTLIAWTEGQLTISITPSKVFTLPKAPGTPTTILSGSDGRTPIVVDDTRAYWFVYDLESHLLTDPVTVKPTILARGTDNPWKAPFIAVDGTHVYYATRAATDGSGEKASIKRVPKGGPASTATTETLVSGGLEVVWDYIYGHRIAVTSTAVWFSAPKTLYRIAKTGGAITKIVEGVELRDVVSQGDNVWYLTHETTTGGFPTDRVFKIGDAGGAPTNVATHRTILVLAAGKTKAFFLTDKDVWQLP